MQAITAFCFFTNYVQNGVDEFCTLGVMSFRPVIPGACLSEHEIVRSEYLAIWARPNTVHGAGLQIHQHSSGDVTASTCFVEVNVDPFEL